MDRYHLYSNDELIEIENHIDWFEDFHYDLIKEFSIKHIHPIALACIYVYSKDNAIDVFTQKGFKYDFRKHKVHVLGPLATSVYCIDTTKQLFLNRIVSVREDINSVNVNILWYTFTPDLLVFILRCGANPNSVLLDCTTWIMLSFIKEAAIFIMMQFSTLCHLEEMGHFREIVKEFNSR